MSIIKWKTLEEVAYRANNTPFGLAAGIWSKSADTIQYLSRTLKAGSVFVNCYNIFDAALPFGGARPGMYFLLFLFAGALRGHQRQQTEILTQAQKQKANNYLYPSHFYFKLLIRVGTRAR